MAAISNTGSCAILHERRQGETRIRAIWRWFPISRTSLEHDDPTIDIDLTNMTPERAERFRIMCDNELKGPRTLGKTISNGWKDILDYADKMEAELWTITDNGLSLKTDGHFNVREWAKAMGKPVFDLTPATLTTLMIFLTPSPYPHALSSAEFHGFLPHIQHRASATEIDRYYEVRGFFKDDGRGTVGLDIAGHNHGRALEDCMHDRNGDVNPSAEDPSSSSSSANSEQIQFSARNAELSHTPDEMTQKDGGQGSEQGLERNNDEHRWYASQTVRYLFAGGVAGAVSRTATAPFDRLKIFLITRPPDLGGLAGTPAVAPTQGVRALAAAVARLYAEGGVWTFWVGNGLNILKIFPESAVKFMTYEQTKKLFAKHWDHVEDPRNISGGSRFISGGMGGILSQLFIYPIETLKTQMMSSTREQARSIASSMKRLLALGGIPAFYRGLTIGIIGVFPYSAIDMSTFEALKLAYLRSTAKEEPGILALLAFGSISGSIGATSVYPLNFIRTRLQAAGSSGHPRNYRGVWDVATKTMASDGWRGFYRGLLPTLAKVVPSVSISYLVYENTKRKLGV